MKKQINYKNLESFSIPLTDDLKSYIGFVRNEYNNNLGKKKYEEFKYLDKNTLKNIKLNFEMRENDSFLTRKKKNSLVPRQCITVSLKQGIAYLRVNKNVEYHFDFRNMNLKDGIYTSVYIYFGKVIKVLIDRSKRRPNKKYISINTLNYKKKVKIDKLTEKTLRKYKRIKNNKDFSFVKLQSEYILNIVKFMKELSEFNCAQKSDIIRYHTELQQNFSKDLESQEKLTKIYNNLKKSIIIEFSTIKMKYVSSFLRLVQAKL